MTYSGKRVLVTGAASGMGRAVTELLVERGALVQALDVRPVELPGVTARALDLRDPDQIDEAVAGVDGRLDAVFHCAGLPHTFPPGDIMKVNFLGLRHLNERILGRLGPGSAVACIASTGGLGWPQQLADIRELLAIDDYGKAAAWCVQRPDLTGDGGLAYRFSKACLIVYTMMRAFQLIGDGIRLNCTSPSDTATPMTEHFRSYYGDEFWSAVPRPAGRPATPVEQAHPLLFLNSDEAAYIAGTNLIVDGALMGGLITGQVQMPQPPASPAG
jgi:NAD(P)-dependent dehydrogenase (short-subunit alcohol dehydrogenase family)